ncbi:MAG: class C sortase [Lachnospiraceae bacterium]|nr:class C sortase [Lachnospiraceae bacterium]
MKRKVITLLAVLIVLGGIIMLMYPVVSNRQFQKSQQELISYYENQVQEIPAEEIDSMWDSCREYNESLLSSKVVLTDPFDTEDSAMEEHPYIDLLNQNGDGAMCSLEIPAVGCKLVVYHYTTEDVLAKGVGHLQGTSLPVGGTGTHAVLSGHTGTADKELFTNLDQVRIGDVFYIHVLGEILAYQVDNKSVVLPDETEGLYIDSEKDLVTLVTCTPYGVNSHRLLVRGTRIPYEEAKEIEKSMGKAKKNTWKSQYFYAILIGIAVSVMIIILIVTVYQRIGKKQGKTDKQKAETDKNKPETDKTKPDAEVKKQNTDSDSIDAENKGDEGRQENEKKDS